MTAYFDELTKQVSFANVFSENTDAFLAKVDEIEQRLQRAVEAVAKLEGFPDDLRDKIARAIARTVSGKDRDYKLNVRASVLVADLHSIFHEVASRKIQTQFGVLSDDPVGSLKRLDANAKDAFEEHIDTCEACRDLSALGATGFCDAGNVCEAQWTVVFTLMTEGVPPEEYPK